MHGLQVAFAVESETRGDNISKKISIAAESTYISLIFIAALDFLRIEGKLIPTPTTREMVTNVIHAARGKHRRVLIELGWEMQT